MWLGVDYYPEQWDKSMIDSDLDNIVEMGGNVMRIRGAASYDFVNDDVDAAMLLYPFEGMKSALISGISTLVNPISSVIQVTVDGKISDPSVGMQVRPLNFIQSESKILENIRDSL